MGSTKREFPPEAGDPESKRAKVFKPDSCFPTPKQRVVLNPADCNLDFNIDGDGLQGSALYEHGFAYCWSGARANVGITCGKYYFSCKIVLAQPVEMEDTPPDQQHVCRVGISRGDDTVGNLGETEHSFGFGGTGKFSSGGKFSDYGEKFGVGDTILCAVDLENKPLAAVGFYKNGKSLGIAKQFDAGPKGLGVVGSPKEKWGSALFPHILLKNVMVNLQFGSEEGLLKEGYKPWVYAMEDGNAVMGPTLPIMKDCEVMMMVGLPASGKTTWAEKWMKEHPDKRYILLGTNLALDQMKVPGLLRKHNYGERFDRLMDRATGIFNTLLSRAAKMPRNYILDQTNVYKSARKRKLRPFANFRKIAVVVYPRPEELKIRSEKRFREMGKEVPAEAVNEMLANFVLPGSDEYIDEVIFTELNRVESQRHLDEQKSALASTPKKRDYSPYSQESSLQSFNNSSLKNQEISIASGSWRGLRSPLPPFNYDYGRPEQVYTPYQEAGLCRDDEPYRRSSGGETRNYPNPYTGSQSSFRGGGAPEPYGSSSVENRFDASSYGSLNSRERSFYRSPPESAVSPYPYGSYGASLSSPVPRSSFQAQRESSYFSPTGYGSPYSTPSSGPYGMRQHGPWGNPPRPWQ